MVTVVCCHASTIRVGIPYIAQESEKLDDLIPMFVARLFQVAEQDFTSKILPFKRSIIRLNNNELDVHIPFAYFPSKDQDNLSYQYTSATFWTVNMVLYTHNDSPVTLTNLARYRIVTDHAHVELFNFPIKPISDIESAIRMVEVGRLDGLIFAEPVVDRIIRKLKLKHIKRTHHSVVDVKGLIHRGKNTEYIDQKISDAVDKMTASGELERFTSPWSHYNDWQPYLTDYR